MLRIGDDPRHRAVIILAMLGLQVGMGVHYGNMVAGCPSPECIDADYVSYVGHLGRFGGDIINTSPPVLAVSYDDDTLELRLVNFTQSVDRGDRVVVYGQLQSDRRLTVRDSIRHRPANRLYMFAISFLALLGVAIIGLYYWQFDMREFVFRRGER